ncbi:YHS domain-containing (seleno)protein [Hyphomonas sp.]|uniref:YHS domain-containing (seleno)protein n=1 Tax=Hyphomonas sp. TaxID=87 RepID=UPI00391CD95F
MSLRTLLAAAAIGLASPLIIALPASAEPPIYTGAFSDLAVQGYDPVAYFNQGQPVRGSRDFTTSWMGAIFRFASAANRDAFIANPEAFAPQYGGYCAWAVSQGYHAKGDARFWKIVDGKLYLNYDASVQRKWEADVPGFISSADQNWPRINRR